MEIVQIELFGHTGESLAATPKDEGYWFNMENHAKVLQRCADPKPGQLKMIWCQWNWSDIEPDNQQILPSRHLF